MANKKIRDYLYNIVNLSNAVDVQQAQVNIRSNIAFRGPTVYILAIAIVIASIGLNVNSIPVIIGAMLISPLMGPIFGFGLGFGTNDMPLILRSLKHLAVMMLISISASTIYFILTPLKLPDPSELMARTSPTVYDVLIAFFGGLAGMLETARKERGTVMSGVAIATALMPPLCTVGFGIATMNWMYALGALYLFMINCIFITLAGWIMVKYLRFPAADIDDTKKQKRRSMTIGVILAILIVPSVFTAVSVVKEANMESNLKIFLAGHRTMGKSYIYDTKTVETGKFWKKEMEVELYMAGEQLSDEAKLLLSQEASMLGLKVCIHDAATVDYLSESEAIKFVQEKSNALIAEKDERINKLEAELSMYKAKALPSEQLTKEAKTQFPAILSLVAVWVESTTSGGSDSVGGEQVLVVVTSSSRLGSADVEKLSAWIKARLNVSSVRIVTEVK